MSPQLRPAHRLILASTSAARRALFDQVGLHYEAEAPHVDEHLDRTGPPVEQACGLALLKANAVAARHPDSIVVGADQVLSFEGEVWAKPTDATAATAQLARLAGKTHSLITGLALVVPGRGTLQEAVETRLRMRSLEARELDAYVRTGEWQGCVGGYRIEGRGLALFEEIDGDYTNILGLPMLRVLTHLRALGAATLGT